jgi:hypothetical protein
MMRAPSNPISVRRAHTLEADELRAVGALAEQLDAADASAVLLFSSGDYDLSRLGQAIEQTFRAPVAACTSAGQIGAGGFEKDGISGVSLRATDLHMYSLLLSPLSSCQSQAVSLAREHGQRSARQPGMKSFGLLLVDGLSLWEEYVAAALYESLGDVPFVGGSASTTARQAPAVYHRGRFHHASAVLALFETSSLGFTTFAVQHFVPSEKKLVITLADPERRVVYEINGEPAARAYAGALGVEPDVLSEQHFARHPLLLDLGEQHLPRAIRAQHADGSFSMACAIDEGLVVSLAESTDPLAALERALDGVQRRVPDPAALLVFDCVLRRVELEARGLDAQVGQLLARRQASGFSGYGEQLGPLHANHTLTGMALGRGFAKGVA